MKLRLEPPHGFPVDEIYERLITMGAERSDRESRQVLAALVLLLVNHIGDPEVVGEAIRIAGGMSSPRESCRFAEA